MCRLNPRSISGFIEFLQPFMLKGFYHTLIYDLVAQHATFIFHSKRSWFFYSANVKIFGQTAKEFFPE